MNNQDQKILADMVLKTEKTLRIYQPSIASKNTSQDKSGKIGTSWNNARDKAGQGGTSRGKSEQAGTGRDKKHLTKFKKMGKII